MKSDAILNSVSDCIAQTGFNINYYSAAADKEVVCETLYADVAIAGGGRAGLVAAVKASSTIMNVILLEKMAALRGRRLGPYKSNG